ncbi:hypothetical protein EMPG_14438 [Blastomyces silverae]|uniref:Protein kinase domain-containing protein n=1 Tax=Blastomyces silverae TaxID=2060906 RepID=A0A0H1BGK2_9EURO|nr:hypothetical protein EMPG_14438 [Blastomyces silverae]
MGQAFSRVTIADPDLENNSNNVDINKYSSTFYGISFGSNVPEELSQEPEHGKHWYTDFLEQAFVAPHRDGKSVVVFLPEYKNNYGYDDEMKAAVVRAAEVYERLCLNHSGHPRIVKYLCRLNSSVAGFCLERLTPGPLDKLKLPPLTLPVVSPSAKDKILLALYYRWALQTLSALHYIHTHSVFLSSFGPNSIWLRADMSIAVTGFIATAIPTLIPEYDELGVETDSYEYVLQTPENAYRSESLELLEHGQPVYGAAHDLFDWATFMWRLMTNDYSTCPLPPPGGYHRSPLMPMGQASSPDFSNDRRPWKYEEKRQEEGAWQVLEEQRLGYILVKAWNRQYENTKGALEDVQKVVQKMGMLLVGEDEVELEKGARWEDVFDVIGTGDGEFDQELRFADNSKEKIAV